MTHATFFVYKHFRLDNGELFYVGKGSVRSNRKTHRSRYYRAYNELNRGMHWKRIAKKHGFRVEIAFEFDNEQAAFDKERELISLYGRLDLNTGCLINYSDGGEGNTGRVVSEATKEKYRLINLGRKHSSDINAKKGSKGELNYFYGKSLSGENNAFYGKKHKEESKRYGKDNHMYGMSGDKNPFFGKSHDPQFLRRKQIMHSNKVKVVLPTKEIKVFECVSDCAEFFDCTTKNILFRDKQIKKGIESKFGKFKGITLEIINND